jgi:hypothetical protein
MDSYTSLCQIVQSPPILHVVFTRAGAEVYLELSNPLRLMWGITFTSAPVLSRIGIFSCPSVNC